MQELKSRVLEVLHGVNDEWVKALRESYKNNTKVSSVEMMGKYSEKINKLDQYFREAEERQKKKNKSGFFGGK